MHEILKYKNQHIMRGRMKAIIFDLDGTLIDSLPVHRAIMKELCAKYQLPLTDEDFDHLNGMSEKEGLIWLIKEKKVRLSPLTILKEKYLLKKRIMENITLFPDTITTLEYLRSTNTPLALATSSKKGYMKQLLQKFGLEQYFSVLMCANDVKHSKPNPEIFMKAAHKLGTHPSECIVVEDAVNGVIAANRAGMKCVCVLSTTNKALFTGEATPWRFIHKLSELKKLV
jgi:beta-phosphoglucomutase